jgi:hypothetical protein
MYNLITMIMKNESAGIWKEIMLDCMGHKIKASIQRVSWLVKL